MCKSGGTDGRLCISNGGLLSGYVTVYLEGSRQTKHLSDFTITAIGITDSCCLLCLLKRLGKTDIALILSV